MRYYLLLISVLFLIPGQIALSQGEKDKTLLTINGHEVKSGEFEWAYLKNNSGPGQNSIDEYLDLYITFRQKVEAAMDAGLDRTKSFRDELDGYRKQLARNYLTDQGAREKLLRDAYARYREEINAYHVLIKCPLDASPADTLDAWEKAMKVRERIRLGEPFESVARGASDDPFVSVNGGNLGYFTVFQTPLSFEDAVYSMTPGSLSKPVRTASGYHIIKVQDRRKSNGRIRVAHIMKGFPRGATHEQVDQAKKEIDSIKVLIDDGADFSTLARNNSDDIASAQNGGELQWFGAGEMVTEFSEAAFSLLHDGDISEPVKTVYGWHIIKRLEKQPLQQFEEAKKTLEGKLSQSYLLSLSRKSFAEKLKKEYNFKINHEILEWFYSVADSAFRSGNINSSNLHVPGGVLYSFADRSCSPAQFLDYIKEKGPQGMAIDSIRFINSILDVRSYEDLIKYEDSVLENKYPEFRYLVNEFHDGILLFEISDSLVWSRAVKDSSGMRDYYETIKNKYSTAPEAQAIVYTIDNRLGKRRIKKINRNIKSAGSTLQAIEVASGYAYAETDTLITVTQGTWRSGENKLLDKMEWTLGYKSTSDNRFTYLVEFIKLNKSGFMEFDSVKDSIINDYMNYLEEEWVKQLRIKYPVIIDRTVLENLKKKLE